MALKVKLDIKQTGIGLGFTEAYARVAGFQCAPDGAFTVGVDIFVDENARRAGARPVLGVTVKVESFDFGAEVGVKRLLYQAVKRNDLFASAADA